ncbi:hypothetical protein BP6252_10818 [Coleophoma cylindrospora]|uniref:Uncharacterized protein n=1 Tax=Coleophoma cylindrospora TaxID=1849047 RepID=A0A3D8QN74_9HELO|nr:hypothetical protein BP6252_10818 [Coleophoma cylindrospora]
MASQLKSVLITGCSAGGIGAALAEVFLEKGYHVFATLRSPSKISETLSNATNATILKLDVLSSESIETAVENVKSKTGGRLDVLVNNSGQVLIAPGLDVSFAEGKRLFDLNFWAPLAMLQAFSPLLIQAKGCVVNNSSANAVLPMPFMSMYNASKAAFATASETWRHELQPLGVRTITVITCAVKTHALDNRQLCELPKTSKYLDIQEFIREITGGKLQANAISSRQYAVHVVGLVEKGTVGPVWAGKDAFMGRIVWWLSPQLIKDMIVQSIIPISSKMAKVAQKSKA